MHHFTSSNLVYHSSPEANIDGHHLAPSPSPVLQPIVPVLSCFSVCAEDGKSNRDRKEQVEDVWNLNFQLSQAGWGAPTSGLLGPRGVRTLLLGDFDTLKKRFRKGWGNSTCPACAQGPLIPGTVQKEKKASMKAGACLSVAGFVFRAVLEPCWALEPRELQVIGPTALLF